jgi:hypothetical protein
MAAEHPVLTAAIVAVLVVLCLLLIRKLFGALKRAVAGLRQGRRAAPPS